MIPLDRLRRFELVSALPEASVRAIASISTPRQHQPGDWILKEGFPARSVMLLESGQVPLTCRLADGSDINVGQASAGDLLGWSALLPPYRLTASARAETGVTLIEIDAVELRRICERDPAVGYPVLAHVASTLSRRLQAARVQIAVLSGMTARGRLERAAG